ncbi:hypothetical protein [Aneurinibacillus danicus]|uniref:Uncharacterized protein n=1 Tax=Aneurinibacillus danicus TaxID=267746 RepID=A0A511VAC0_9BACL|nr:hypothetical protein [Aneurinibacillus danicus]GEN35880.1 hypothetical protein ADA01nite_33400 [Aneurinibacillus danicus]
MRVNGGIDPLFPRKLPNSNKARNSNQLNMNSNGNKPNSSSNGTGNSIFKSGRITIEAIESNPHVFSGKSANEIAEMLKKVGYDVMIQTSKKSRSGAEIIKINNHGNGRNITQVQVSPGGGRHGENPYVKISTSDQGIIKIVNGVKSTYKTDGAEKAKIIFTGGK